MSLTYSFLCDDCKIKVWCGQGDYLYDDKNIPRFLHEHHGHKLRFLCDQSDDDMSEDYKEYEEK